jgi:hypothetical protein
VSDLLTSSPGDDEDGSRGRAVWGLVALAIVAGLIVVIMLATSGGSGGHHSGSAPSPSQLPSEPPSTPTTTPSTTAASTSAASSSTATSPIPTGTGNPCGAAKSCAVPGDAGQLVAAINRFRTAHGQAAVTGTATPKAQQCAVAQGNGPNCAPSYAWEPVPTQDGSKAVGLVSPQWLLDPAVKSFEIGWAYANGQWECAILKLR